MLPSYNGEMFVLAGPFTTVLLLQISILLHWLKFQLSETFNSLIIIYYYSSSLTDGAELRSRVELNDFSC
jgi:hypothetical protein